MSQQMTKNQPGATDFRARAEALLEAARDVWPEPKHRTPARLNAEQQHLLAQYTTELRRAKEWAESDWKSRSARAPGQDDPASRMVAALLGQDAAPPATHGNVVHVLRRYWLACAALNARLAAEQRIQPEECLLGTLLREGPEDLARFLSDLPYWPIGMDAAGEWV